MVLEHITCTACSSNVSLMFAECNIMLLDNINRGNIDQFLLVQTYCKSQ